MNPQEKLYHVPETPVTDNDSNSFKLWCFLEDCGIDKHFATLLKEKRVSTFEDLITFVQMTNRIVSGFAPMLNDPQWQRGVWNSIIDIDSTETEKKICTDFIALVASNLHFNLQDKEKHTRPLGKRYFGRILESEQIKNQHNAALENLEEKINSKEIDKATYWSEMRRLRTVYDKQQKKIMTDFFNFNGIPEDFVHTLKKKSIFSLHSLHVLIGQQLHQNNVDILRPLQRNLWNMFVTSTSSIDDKQLVEKFIRNDRVLALANLEPL